MTVACIVSVVGPAEARQGPFDKHLLIGIDLVHLGRRDELISPRRYTGTSVALSLGYSVSPRRHTTDLLLRVGGSHLEPAGGEVVNGSSAGGVRVDLRGTHVRTLGAAARRFRWQVGGRIDVQFDVQDHQYGRTQSDLFGNLFASLEPTGGWAFALTPRHHITQRASVPLVSLVMRSPPFGLKHLPAVAIEGPTTLTGLVHELAFRYAPGRWGVTLHHEIRLLRYPHPQTLRSAQQRVRVAGFVGLGGTR